MKKYFQLFSRPAPSLPNSASHQDEVQISKSNDDKEHKFSNKPYGLMDLNPGASPFVLKKLNALYSLLWQGKKQYEEVAQTISDKEFRRTILTLAQESNQYACELSCQIETLGGLTTNERLNENEKSADLKSFKDEKEILSFCMDNENKMVSAYRDILNESFLYEGLRNMIRYQLNGINCAFMQIKLLTSLNFHYSFKVE